MRGKRELVSDLCAAAGATWLLERFPSRPVLMILNYHRIGDKEATAYDPGLFSCTAGEFDWQVDYVKRRFRMATLDDVMELLSGERRLTEPQVLITFDDGYIDNYQLAYPVLRRHGVQGVFFLPTGFVGTAAFRGGMKLPTSSSAPAGPASAWNTRIHRISTWRMTESPSASCTF